MAQFVLKPSRYLAIVLFAVHLAAFAVLVPLALPPASKAALGTLIAASLAYSLRRHAFLNARAAVTAIELKDRSSAVVQTRDGHWREADVLGTSYVSPRLTVLNLRIRGLKFARHVVIMPDTIDPEDFRRLRVLLRWGYRRESSKA